MNGNQANGSLKVVTKDHKGTYVSTAPHVKVNPVSCGCGPELTDPVVDVAAGVVVGRKVAIVL